MIGIGIGDGVEERDGGGEGGRREWGRERAAHSCIAAVELPLTLVPLQCRDGARRMIIYQTSIRWWCWGGR